MAVVKLYVVKPGLSMVLRFDSKEDALKELDNHTDATCWIREDDEDV